MANAPMVDPTATTTAPAKGQGDQVAICESVLLPAAVLSFGEQEQREARVATNWQSDGCPISSHPIDTLPLPETALKVPSGASPSLTFSIEPSTVSGYAWRPDFSSAEELFGRKVEVPFDGLRGSTRVDLDFEAVASQDLDLTSLPPGEYAIEVFASWDDGSSGFAFRVEILEP